MKAALTRLARELGFSAIGFTNAEIDNSFSAVCDLIDAAVRRKTDRI